MFVCLSTISANAQAVTPTGSTITGLPNTQTQPQIFKSVAIMRGVVNTVGAINATGKTYENSGLFYGVEKTTSRNYTVLGTYPLFIDSASYQLDSITLSGTYLKPGQIIRILANGVVNDTLAIFHDHSFNGATATPYLLSPATSAAIKKAVIYVDVYGNYWTL